MIWRGLDPDQRAGYAAFALAILGVAVIARLGWVMTYNSVVRLKNRIYGADLPAGETPPDFRHGVVVGWAGMRGVVSLAASYALPYDFPHRDLILLSTFAVVMGTLVVQGLTLGPLIRLLKIEDDGRLAMEIKRARQAVSQAAVDDLKGKRSRVARRLADEYGDHLEAVNAADADVDRVETESDRLRGELLVVKREALMTLRTSGEIGEAAYYQVEEELDRHELSLTPVVR